MGNPTLTDHKIGAVEDSGTNAELDLIHDRLNRTINSGDVLLNRVVTDANYVIKPNDSYVGVLTVKSAVTLTLPNVTSIYLNRVLVIKDESANANNNNITVLPFDAINGKIDKATSKTISSASGVLWLMSNGVEWFSL